MSPTLVTAAEAFALPFYREAHRAYHNEAHVRTMLAALEARGVLTSTLALAVWGHDLIYDPRAHDNEERSADQFDAWLAGHGAEKVLREAVRSLILATRHSRAPADAAEALIVDADLAILGSNECVFDDYDAAIRQEYAHVSDSAYRAGRSRILHAFLARSRIFTTPEFSALEPHARRNLTRAIARLGDTGVTDATGRP